MTYNLSRLSYARVLVELNLREDLQHSVEVSLPSGPILHQKVVYETLPKFYNYCNVLGHTRLLCPKAAASNTTEANTSTEQSQPLPVQGTLEASSDTIIMITEKTPCAASNGWIMVEPKRKSNKHTRGIMLVVEGSPLLLHPHDSLPLAYQG
ncbi:hypothetical protein H0E87_014993, partial [Populus deltoides]